MKFLKKKGFTLIELLVVVAIIGILATVVISNLSESRKRAKMAKFQSELVSFKSAMELYYIDNGHYPYYSGKTNVYSYDFFANGSGGVGAWNTEFTSEMTPYFNIEAFTNNFPSELGIFNYYRTGCDDFSPTLTTTPNAYRVQFVMTNGIQLEPHYTSTTSGIHEQHLLCSPN